MRVKLGDDATAEWLEGIADNDAFTFANNNAIVAAVGRGEIDVGLVNHYYVYQALAEDPDFAGEPRLPARRHRQPAHRHRRVGAQELRQPGPGGRAGPLPAGGGGAALLLGSDLRVSARGGRPAASVLPAVEFVAVEGIDLDELGGGLESTRQMIRDAGLEG